MNLITNKKKIISFIVAAVVAVSLPCDISAKEATGAGDFRMIRTYDFETFGADVHVYEHIKTGANVVFIRNDDPNKYFMLEFDTPTRDDKGLPHVFEHSAMCGSKKYPSRSLTTALYNRSYLTYGNALTRDKCTIFPIASLSEGQLVKFADYYLDLCFEPSIMTDEDIFRSEAWRFSLEDENDDLTINGTIYSEMMGNYTADRAAIRKAIGLLYPGSASSFESGGIPSEILKLSYEDVKAFHEQYYHPSNCTAYLYGDIKNEQAFLDLLSGYFGRYEKKDIDVKVGSRRPEEGFVGRAYEFPAAEGTDPSGNTEMVYALDLGDPSDIELQELYAFIACLNTYPGTVTMILRSEFPGARFDFNIEQDQNGALLYVSAGGMNEEDANRLRDTLEKIFVMLSDSGLDEDELEDYRFKAQTDTALARESQTAALSLLSNISNLNSCGRGHLFYMDMRDRMRDMKWFDNDLVKDIASRFLVSPKRSAMSVVVQKAGLAEENEAQLAKLLSDKKKSMTAEEKKKLVSSTKRITEKASDDPSKYLDKIRVVNASNLPTVAFDHTIVDKTDENGVRSIWVSTDVDAVNATEVYLDASSISQDRLGYLALFVDLVNGHFVPTGKHSSSELFDMISDSMYREEDISLDVSSNGNDFKPYLVAYFMCDPKRQQEAFDLTYEMLFDSRFEDAESVRKGASVIKSTIQKNIERNPESLIRYTGYAAGGQGAAYYEYTHYLEYYDLLLKIEKMNDEELGKVMSELSDIGKTINNSRGAVMGYAVSPKERGAYEKYLADFTDRLENKELEKRKYSFDKNRYPLAIETNRQNVFNGIFSGDVSAFGIEDNASAELALNLITNEYVKPNVRDRYGAYQCTCRDEYPVLSIVTGNDPMIEETNEIFDGIGEAWKDIRETIDVKTLSEYIVTMHSKATVSNGSINDALSVIAGMVCGKNAHEKQVRALQIRKITLVRLEEFDALFDDLSKNGARVTVGSPELIEKNRTEYSYITDPFGKQ